MKNQVVKKILLIDDCRPVSIIRTYLPSHVPCDVITARSYDAGIAALQAGRDWDMLFIDHDLGDFQAGKERTGYHILCWLEEHPEYIPDQIYVITSNASVLGKMKDLAERLVAIHQNSKK